MKNVVYSLILSGLTSALITGCGNQSSNPKRDFNITGVPANGLQNANSDVLGNLLKIDVVENKSANFVEEQSGQIRFNVRVLDPHVTEINLKMVEGTEPGAGATNEANIARVGRVPNSPSEWILSWTPQKGIIPPGTLFYKTKVQLIASVLKTSDPALATAVAQSEVQIFVGRTNKAPTIGDRSQLASNVEESTATPFSIVVSDPAKMTSPPTLQISQYFVTDNREAYKADGSGFVFPVAANPVDKLPDGSIRYNYVFDTRNQELPYPLNIQGQRDSKATGVELCFNVKAFSPSGNQSPERTICTKVRYAAQAPDMTFEDQSAQTQLTTGVPAVIKFTVQSPNGRGSVSVENMTTSFSKWLGKPTFKCDEPVAGQETVQNCQVEWNVPCNATTGKRQLTFKAIGKLGKQVRVKTVTREVIVSNSADTCKPEPKATTVVIAPTAPKTGAAK